VKIAQVIGSLLEPLGGAEQYVLEVSRAQAAAGHEVTVITGWVSPAVAVALAADGVTVEVVRMRRPYPPDRRGPRAAALLFHALDLVDSIRTPRALRRMLDRPWDVAHVHRVAGLGAGLMRSTPAPVVVTVHDYSLVDTRSSLLRSGVIAPHAPLVQRIRSRILSRALARATFVFPSHDVLARHRAWGLTVPKSSVVLPHGWRVGAAKGDQRPPQPVVFLFLGKLIETKGVALLLEAWGSGLPEAELWFAGAGELEPEVVAAANTGRVRHLGWLDAAGRDAALAAASVMVLPSTGPEIFLLAAAEGALAGLPVISTTVAAPPAVRDGESGILVEPRPADLRAAMQRLLDPTERSRLSAGARDFSAELDFDRHLELLLEVYAVAGARTPEGVR
jgi:glycosyltransferase involved in cell wall biosynthesis